MNNFKVYVHIAPNNKMYIGITSKSTKKRWGTQGQGYQGNTYFYNAIQKYGWDNFKHIVLFENLSEDMALLIEQALIIKYQTNLNDKGYNRAVGGRYGGCGYTYAKSESAKLKISKAKKGVKLSKAHVQSLKNAWNIRRLEGRGVAWNKGKHLKETGMLDNFLKAGLQNIENRKVPVLQIDLNTNQIINEFDSLLDASRHFDRNYITSIKQTADGQRRSAFGYGWKYKDASR